MDFDNFCSFFECHSILAEKQRTKQTNYSSLSLSGSLDTQDTFQGGIIVEWNTFCQEIPVCITYAINFAHKHGKNSFTEEWHLENNEVNVFYLKIGKFVLILTS